MKKIFSRILSLVLIGIGFVSTAQNESLDRLRADLMLHKSRRADIRAAAAAENYLYFSGGILPSETSDGIDKNLALGEDLFTAMEFFIRDMQMSQHTALSGYWHHLRHKTVHTYRKGDARKISENVEELHRRTGEFTRTLIRDFGLKNTAEDLWKWKSLYYTHALSLTYMAALLEPSPYFEMRLSEKIDTYSRLLDGLNRFIDSRADNSYDWQRVKEAMIRFFQLIQQGEKDPEKIYEASGRIHRLLIQHP